MQITTEEEIINFLSKNNSKTIFQIAIHLNLTKADIRYQLNKLQKKGIINKIEPELSHRGRPAARYKISDFFYKNNYQSLFEAIIQLLPPGLDHYSNLGKYFAQKMQIEHNQSTILKLNNLISNFNIQNYDARWETQFHGPVVFFANCPYRQLINEYPGLCTMDKEIIEKGMNMKVNTIHTIAEGGKSFCKFQIIIK